MAGKKGSNDLRSAIDLMVKEKGIPVELVLDTIEQTLKATYKNKYKTDENAVVTFSENYESVELASRKLVVDDDDFEDDVLQIPLSEAKELNDDAEIGDELLITIDPKTFNRGQVQTGKQRAQSQFREIQKDELYSEFKNKVGEIINGYVQTVQENGDIMVNLGKTSGYLPRKNQSPKETYQKGDRIRCYVESVRPDEKNEKNIRVLLSRASDEFIKKLFFLNVPELSSQDPAIEIVKVVREPGYRTKVSVWPKKQDIDAVGTCVGLKGARIQAIMNEIDGERIDVVRWDPNPLEYISQALSPAKVERIFVTDYDKKMAIAIVDPTQLSLAIGKQGLNVRLVNRMCDWLVDVKTQEDFEKLDIFEEARANADAVFDNSVLENENNDDEGIPLSDYLNSDLSSRLEKHDILYVEDFLDYSDDELRKLGDITDEEIAEIHKVIDENFEFEEKSDDTDEVFECPECGHPLTVGMTECPNCHVPISFE